MFNFPPKPKHSVEIDNHLKLLAGILKRRSVMYVSAPITSGRRFLDWHARVNGNSDASTPEYQALHVREVIMPNRIHAESLVSKLRRQYTDMILVDPTAVEDLNGWTQDDYRYFWSRFIEQYACTVVFSEDWQYSLGCAYEFLSACHCGIERLDEHLNELTSESGRQLIAAAGVEMKAHGLPSEFLDKVAGELMQRCAPEMAEEMAT